MAQRTTLLVYSGLFLLGLVLLAIGALTQPYRIGALTAKPTPGSEAGESLIAIGLTLIIVGIGYFLAYANPTR
jgi:hypothetical protein